MQPISTLPPELWRTEILPLLDTFIFRGVCKAWHEQFLSQWGKLEEGCVSEEVMRVYTQLSQQKDPEDGLRSIEVIVFKTLNYVAQSQCKRYGTSFLLNSDYIMHQDQFRAFQIEQQQVREEAFKTVWPELRRKLLAHRFRFQESLEEEKIDSDDAPVEKCIAFLERYVEVWQQHSVFDELHFEDLRLKVFPYEVRLFGTILEVHCERNQITQFPSFEESNQLTIIDLFIEENQINTLPDVNCCASWHLSYNKIEVLPPNLSWNCLPGSIDFSFNQIENIPENFVKLTEIATLDLSHNCLTQNPPTLSARDNPIQSDCNIYNSSINSSLAVVCKAVLMSDKAKVLMQFNALSQEEQGSIWAELTGQEVKNSKRLSQEQVNQVCDDLSLLKQALKRYLFKRLNALSEEKQNILYNNIYAHHHGVFLIDIEKATSSEECTSIHRRLDWVKARIEKDLPLLADALLYTLPTPQEVSCRRESF